MLFFRYSPERRKNKKILKIKKYTQIGTTKPLDAQTRTAHVESGAHYKIGVGGPVFKARRPSNDVKYD